MSCSDPVRLAFSLALFCGCGTAEAQSSAPETPLAKMSTVDNSAAENADDREVYRIDKFGPLVRMLSPFINSAPLFDRIIGYDEMGQPIWEKEEKLRQKMEKRKQEMLAKFHLLGQYHQDRPDLSAEPWLQKSVEVAKHLEKYRDNLGTCEEDSKLGGEAVVGHEAMHAGLGSDGLVQGGASLQCRYLGIPGRPL